jgi:hypothetical protein
VQDAFFHFFSMLLNGAYASKFETGWERNFLLAWAGQFSGIKNQTMHRFEQYPKILQLYHENSRFPPSLKVKKTSEALF